MIGFQKGGICNFGALIGLLVVQLSVCAVGAEPSIKTLPVLNRIDWQTMSPFNLGEVGLVASPFEQTMGLEKQRLLSLDVSRLLDTFRKTAGLHSSVESLGGWERPGSELRGATAGHYLTACSMMYAGTGDEQLKGK